MPIIETELEVRDRVRINEYNETLNGGEVGRIESMDGDKIVVRFPNGKYGIYHRYHLSYEPTEEDIAVRSSVIRGHNLRNIQEHGHAWKQRGYT